MVQNIFNTDKLGILTSLSKPANPEHYIKDWRPTTLLKCTYTTNAGCIAIKIKNVLYSKRLEGFY